MKVVQGVSITCSFLLFSLSKQSIHYSQVTCFNWTALASSATASPAVVKRSALFSSEKKRQRQSVGRIEKIEVDLVSDFGNELLIMNKELSTPHDCAKRKR